jgi:hypothetical protein
MEQIFGALTLGCILWATPSHAAPSGTVLCYVLANQPTANSPYTPDSRSSYNANAICRSHLPSSHFPAYSIDSSSRFLQNV